MPYLVAMLSLMILALPGAASARPGVELITIGPGGEAYTRFGHSALLVTRDGKPGLVYNYGLSDFERSGLVWDFIRGRPQFWVATQDWPGTVAYYRSEDRTITRQPLRLGPRRTRALVRALEQVVLPPNRYYTYHHFRNNCATRPRDLVDRIVGGAVGRQLRTIAAPATLRDTMRQGFAGHLGLLVATDLLVGRVADQPITRWQAAFLPADLALGLGLVQLDRHVLLDPGRVVYARRGPDPRAHDPLAGVKLLWVGVGLAALLGLALWWLARHRSRWAGAALLALSLPLGLLSLLFWTLLFISLLPELKYNEAVLALWPTDLLLALPAVRWLRGRLWAGRLLRGYAWVRLVGAALVLVGHLGGVLTQRPLVLPALAVCLALGLVAALQVTARLQAPVTESEQQHAQQADGDSGEPNS